MLIPVRPFCATISRQRLALRNWEKQQALRPKVSFACLVRVETHRPGTYSASLVTCKSARAWSCTLERFRAKWIPVRVKKTRQDKNLEPRSDSIGTEKALVERGTGDRGHNRVCIPKDAGIRAGAVSNHRPCRDMRAERSSDRDPLITSSLPAASAPPPATPVSAFARRSHPSATGLAPPGSGFPL